MSAISSDRSRASRSRGASAWVVYFQVSGGGALASIGLIAFAGVAQFLPSRCSADLLAWGDPGGALAA
jgi:hypothetical protein